MLLLITSSDRVGGHEWRVVAQIQLFELVVSPWLLAARLPNLSATFASPVAERNMGRQKEMWEGRNQWRVVMSDVDPQSRNEWRKCWQKGEAG